MGKSKPLNENDREDLVAYLDNELDKKSARELEAKLNVDPQARKEAETLRRTWELLDYLPRPEPSPNFTHRTMEKLAAQPIAPRKASRGRTWFLGLGWAASILLAVASGYAGVRFVTKPTPEKPETPPAVADQQLVQELRIIENIHQYEHVDDIDFLHKLANANDSDLFGDDNLGS